MYQQSKYIYYQQKMRWKRFIREIPSVLQRAFLDPLVRSIMFIFIALILLLFFSLLFIIVDKLFRIELFHSVTTWIAMGTTFFLLIVLRGISKTVKTFHYTLFQYELLGILPMKWKDLYLCNLIERNVQPIMLTWLVLGLCSVSAVITLKLSWLLLLLWFLLYPIFIIQLFVVRDIIAVWLSAFFRLFNIKIIHHTRFSLGILVRRGLFFIFIATVFSFVISQFIFNMTSFLRDLSTLASVATHFLLTVENPLKWMSTALYTAALGEIPWLEIIYLYLVGFSLCVVLERSLFYLELKDILPLFYAVQPTNEYEERERTFFHNPVFEQNQIVQIIRKDLKYLWRDPVIMEQIYLAISYICMLIGFLLGLFLSSFEVEQYHQLVLELSLTFKWFIMFFLTFLLTSLIAGMIKQITSFDAEGRNMHLFRGAPMNMSLVVYSKLLLHFLVSFFAALICMTVCTVIFKLPFLYFILMLITFLSVAAVFSVIHVGATALFPRYDWEKREDIGKNYNASLFRLSEYFYIFILLFVFITEVILLKYVGFSLNPLMLISLMSGTTIFLSLVIVRTFIKIIDQKMKSW
ncbi:hypothetical protein [Caldalkalibacillus mannanilyticus]|uniref:hypothetical protein n=1 Tax=Caldalkalibacillus mannanilyticus TaxID=1418 RepID=UPI00046A422D|nr:hypothetical protein [Caldalkalibacillus mannanilyticus]